MIIQINYCRYRIQFQKYQPKYQSKGSELKKKINSRQRGT